MRFNAKQLKEMSNMVRSGALAALIAAKSGHVGIVLDAADVVTTIYANFLRRGRDKFVLSAGHGSALLYSVLNLAGYNVGDLNSFRKLGGLPGHPELGIDGVDATTGPLGQGVGNAVGYALAEKMKKSDARVYCLCGDGDLMEGVAQESIAFAGRYKLNNLVLIWDDNKISIDGVAQTDIDIPARMRAAGWNVVVAESDDFAKLNKIFTDASRKNVPTFVQFKTTIGAGSSVAGTPRAHGYGVAADELEKLAADFASAIGLELWAVVAKNAADIISPASHINLPEIKFSVDADKISTRELSGVYLRQLIDAGVSLVVGSADLGGSTNVKSAASIEIAPDDFAGNYINYGVREHAMGAIMNGMAADGMRPVGSTFLVFSDYLRPSIRIAAFSGLPVIYVFTHDSICVGEDGPTHQPIEQLPSLRLIPNLNVFRPCNGDEVAFAWRAAISNTDSPTALILSRQKFEQVPTPAGADIGRGGYVIVPAKSGRVRATIIATGAEVAIARAVALKMGDDVQVVSMPWVAGFRAQNEKYKREILRGTIVAIEAAATAPWFEFADIVIGIDSFGASGTCDDVYRYFGFDADAIAEELSRKIK